MARPDRAPGLLLAVTVLWLLIADCTAHGLDVEPDCSPDQARQGLVALEARSGRDGAALAALECSSMPHLLIETTITALRLSALYACRRCRCPRRGRDTQLAIPEHAGFAHRVWHPRRGSLAAAPAAAGFAGPRCAQRDAPCQPCAHTLAAAWRGRFGRAHPGTLATRHARGAHVLCCPCLRRQRALGHCRRCVRRRRLDLALIGLGPARPLGPPAGCCCLQPQRHGAAGRVARQGVSTKHF